MGKIERGERNVTALNLLRVAKALGVQPSEIFSKAEL
jgi:transcriptional regulator with XRE-family HTH domain